MDGLKIYAFADEAGRELDVQILAMKENGLDGLEIRGVDGENISVISTQKAKQIHEKMSQAGLSVWSIGSPSGKINIKDDFSAHLDEFKHMLELADILQAKMFRLFSFYMPKNEDASIYRDEVMLRLNAFCEAAKGSGITLCHENEKGIYGDNAAHCKDILENVEGLAGIFDPANFIQCNQDTMEAWNMLAPYIRYMHIKDCLTGGKVVPAGSGVGNLKTIVESFKAQGGREVTLEPHLTVFDSLNFLEREGEKTNIDPYSYPTQRAAFDAAVQAFKDL